MPRPIPPPDPNRHPAWARAFGNRVRTHRERLGLSQERLGELAGVHRTFVGRVERGHTNPTLGTILLLAGTLDVDPCVLVEGLNPDAK